MRSGHLFAVGIGVAATAAYFVACGGTTPAVGDAPQTFTAACKDLKNPDGTAAGSYAIIDVPSLDPNTNPILSVFRCDALDENGKPSVFGYANGCAFGGSACPSELKVSSPRCRSLNNDAQQVVVDPARVVIKCNGFASVAVRVAF